MADHRSGRDAEARRYAQEQRKLRLVEMAAFIGFLVVVQGGGVSVWLRDHVPSTPWLGATVFASALVVLYALITSPLRVVRGYLLPKRHGLLTQPFGAWMVDQAKGLVIGAVFGFAALQALVVSLRVAPDSWWLIMAVGAFVVAVVVAIVAPVALAPLFYRFTPLTDADLVDRLVRLANRAGASVRGVYVVGMAEKTTGANAALMGLGATRRIVVGDTLLASCDAREIEAVLAHELGHHVHRDIPNGIVLRAIVTLGGLWVADQVMRVGVAAQALNGVTDLAALPLIALGLALFDLVAQPFLNADSRRRERAADRYALSATGDPEAFVSVMLKLHQANLVDPDPPAWARLLFATHPPLTERLAVAQPPMSSPATK